MYLESPSNMPLYALWGGHHQPCRDQLEHIRWTKETPIYLLLVLEIMTQGLMILIKVQLTLKKSYIRWTANYSIMINANWSAYNANYIKLTTMLSIMSSVNDTISLTNLRGDSEVNGENERPMRWFVNKIYVEINVKEDVQIIGTMIIRTT